MKNTWMLVAFIMCCSLALTAIGTGAQSLQPTSPTYSWSAELVALDANSRMATVKARVVGEQALAELPHFRPGDRIVVTWSGFDTYADAISRAVRYDAAKKWSEPFTFPAEFIGYDESQHYVTFKVQVPSTSLDALKSLKPGEWVTAISRHRPSSDADAITLVNAYTAAVSPTQYTSTNKVGEAQTASR
jgi:hypothetical protein